MVFLGFAAIVETPQEDLPPFCKTNMKLLLEILFSLYKSIRDFKEYSKTPEYQSKFFKHKLNRKFIKNEVYFPKNFLRKIMNKIMFEV